MNVKSSTMVVPFGQALDQFRAYQEVVKAGTASKDDYTLYHALRQVTRGRKVIDLPRAIADGGVDEAGRPHLAVARADWPRVFLGTRWPNDASGEQTPRWVFRAVDRFGHPNHTRLEVPTPDGYRDEVFASGGRRLRWSEVEGSALVPTIPPQHRPRHKLHNYHLLFEAEWRPVAPVDPLLLQHVDGPFYVVLAAWDLSPLEQAVLRTHL